MTAFFDFVNRTSSTLLSLDPQTLDQLGQLQGKVLCIEVTAPKLNFYLIPGESGVEICEQCGQPPDVTLRGPVLAFVQLGTGGLESGVLTSGKVTMQGDADTGQAFQKILGQLDIDWEELASRYIGDTPARKLGNVARNLGEWARESSELGRKNTAEYFQEEKRILASPLAMERFNNNVDSLRSDVDRIEQRLNRLEHDAGAGIE